MSLNASQMITYIVLQLKTVKNASVLYFLFGLPHETHTQKPRVRAKEVNITDGVFILRLKLDP